jgi:Fe-S oxidoreductase
VLRLRRLVLGASARGLHAILDKKLANVEATGADCVVACDAGCLMQMRGGLSRRGSRYAPSPRGVST